MRLTRRQMLVGAATSGLGAVGLYELVDRLASSPAVRSHGRLHPEQHLLDGLAVMRDNGVAVINYVDSGGGNVFTLPRDVGIPPLTPVKTTGAPGGSNSGTFNPLAADNEFAMISSNAISSSSVRPPTNGHIFSTSSSGARFPSFCDFALAAEFL